MARVLLLLLVACGGPGYHPIHGGTCPTDTGCEAPIEPAPKFVPPSDPDEVVAARGPATCASVAHVLASTEIGNYADDELLRVKAGKWEQRCAQQRLTLAELDCLGTAGDRAAIATCVPRWQLAR
jgi:hypothetical protein